LKLSDAESVNFHCVPNQVLYQAEPLPDEAARVCGRAPVPVKPFDYSIRGNHGPPRGHVSWTAIPPLCNARLASHA